MEKKPLTKRPETRGGINEKTISIRLSVFFNYFCNNHAVGVGNKKGPGMHQGCRTSDTPPMSQGCIRDANCSTYIPSFPKI